MNNTSLYMPVYDDSVTMVGCRFVDKGGRTPGNVYYYKCAIGVSVGDILLVEASNWYNVVKCVEVDMPIPIHVEAHFRWVVSNITFAVENHSSVLEMEAALIKEIENKRIQNMRRSMIDAIGVASEHVTNLLSYDRHKPEHEQDDVGFSTVRHSIDKGTIDETDTE